MNVGKKKYSYKGEMYSFKELLEFSKVSSDTLRGRLYFGWDLEEAVDTPKMPRGYKYKGKKNADTVVDYNTSFTL